MFYYEENLIEVKEILGVHDIVVGGNLNGLDHVVPVKGHGLRVCMTTFHNLRVVQAQFIRMLG